MDADASASGESHFDNETFFANFENMQEESFLPDGMSDIFGGSSVAGSQTRAGTAAPSEISRPQTARPRVEPTPACESVVASVADDAEQQAQAPKEAQASTATPADATMTDDANAAPAAEQVNVAEQAQTSAPSAGQNADAPAESIESSGNVDRNENGETEPEGPQEQPAPAEPEAPRGRSQSRTSAAMMPPPRRRASSAAPAMPDNGPVDDAPTEIPRPLDLGKSLLTKKSPLSPPSPATSARERSTPARSVRDKLKEKQASSRARHQAGGDEVRQSIERQPAETSDTSDVEITHSRTLHQYEARVFAKSRPVLRYREKLGKLSADELAESQAMEAKQNQRQHEGLISPRHERTPSEAPGSSAEDGADEASRLFKKVKELYQRRKNAGTLLMDEEVEFMKIEAGEHARIRRLRADSVVRRLSVAPRSSSIASHRGPATVRQSPEGESLFIHDDNRSGASNGTQSRRSNFQRPGSEQPRGFHRSSSEAPSLPGRSGHGSSRSSHRAGRNENSHKRFREGSVDMDSSNKRGKFTWTTPNKKSHSNFFKAHKDNQQEYTDAEMNRHIHRAQQQTDDARGRRDRLHINDGFDENISFGDYFLEACKKEERNGVPEAYLENCAELMASQLRAQPGTPQYKGVPTKVRLEKYRNLWKRPTRKDKENGRRYIVKDAVDMEFDKRKWFIYSKIRTSQINLEQACRFAIEWDIQRCRLQRRHLQNAGRSRTQAYLSLDDGPSRFRLPTSGQFATARKPELEPMIEEAGQMMAEALFHVGAASHRIQESFGAVPMTTPSRDSTPGALGGAFVASDTDGVESENGDLFA